MIRYILVDDNPNVLESVKSEIDTLPKEYGLQHIESYDNSKKAFQEINEDDFDLLIVDFEMPTYNGIELAQKIATDKKIVFLTSTTSNEQKVINCLDISGFLSKPFDIHEFETILKNKIVGQTKSIHSKKPSRHITLQIGTNKDVKFLPEQAYYISTAKNINGEKSSKNHVHIYGENDIILFKNVYTSITSLTKILPNLDFEKINQSTIINLSHLKERDNTIISLHNSKETFEITPKEKPGFVGRLRSRFNL